MILNVIAYTLFQDARFGAFRLRTFDFAALSVVAPLIHGIPGALFYAANDPFSPRQLPIRNLEMF